ncbi:MAG: thioesterase family protein [Bacteroidota bacterium]
MPHTYHHRVRYRECDPMGVAYHTHVLDWFEAARTEALRERGVAYKDIEASGIIMPVVDVAVRYYRPVHYDDVIVVETTFPDAPSARIPITYEVFREGTERAVITGRVTLAIVDRERGRPTAAPEMLLAAFSDIGSD